MNKEEALRILKISSDLSDHDVICQVRQQLKKLHNCNTDKLSEKIEACKLLTDGKKDQAEIFSNLVIAAIENQKLDFLELLLQTVENNNEFNYLNTESTGGNIPLNFALRYTIHYDQMVEAIDLLLKHDADPNTKNREGKSSLHCVINNSQNGTFCNRVTESLLKLKLKANPNVTDNQGKTLLHYLFEDRIHDHIGTITLLLKEGADPNVQNGRGESLLYQVYSEKRDDTIRLLLGCNTNLKKSEHVQSLLYKACSEGRDDTVKLLLESGVDPNTKNENGESLLHIACSKGHASIVKLLLEKGVDPNAKDKDDESPLHKACSRGHASIVKLLLEKKGVDPNVQGKDGKSPLHRACSKGHDDIVELLLKHKADPNVKDECGESPLHEALFRWHYNTAELLLNNGANPNVPDKNGKFPLNRARFFARDDIVQLLLKNGADPGLKDKDDKKPINLVSPYSDVGKLFGAIDYNKAAVLGVVTLLATASSIALISGVADAYIGEVWCFVLAVVIIVIALCCAHCAKTQLPPSGPASVLDEMSEECLGSGLSLTGGA